LSQAALADLAGTEQATISLIESGTANVELATLRSICAALDAEVVVIPRKVTGSVRNRSRLSRTFRRSHSASPRQELPC